MNAEQEKALSLVQEGRNIYLGGQAGTGKSYVLKHIVEWAKKDNKHIGLTAMTGAAAVLIKGVTIHSFLSLGLGTKSAQEIANKLTQKSIYKQILTRIKKLEILVIDEISMMPADLLDKIDELLKLIRKKPDKPFGGVQMVFVGDFYQLKPVKGEYCFKAAAWKSCDMLTIELTKLMRQQDVLSQSILQEIRGGKCSKETLEILKKLEHTEFENKNINPTILYSKNVDVDEINTRRFKELVKTGAQTKLFQTKYSGQSGKLWAESSKTLDCVELCIGAQVVVSWNICQESGIINGTRGMIRGFAGDAVIVELLDNREVSIEKVKITCEDDDKMWMEYMPLKLAWALTNFKAQGMTLDYAIVDLAGIFTHGQAYVALSRVRNIANMKVIGVSERCFMTHPEVIQFYKNT
jgi:ATP-dependent exoDNAse (exonuclease V) alpha subunit